MSGFILIFFDDSNPSSWFQPVADGQPEPSSNAGNVKSGGAIATVGKGHASAVRHTASKFEQAVPHSIPALKPVNLRPHCLKPDMCSGYGAHQCHACTKASEVVA